MAANVDTLPIYESMAVISKQMLDAARNANWELLSALELRSSEYTEVLKNSNASEDRIDNNDRELRERKVALIKKILADDRDIRNLTEPWMQELSSLIKNTSNERKLAQAYGVNQDI
jgi:flagellar protein FliT